jgi:hypothetical protein
MRLHRHLMRINHAVSDICYLSLYFMAGFAVALLTEPRLHLTRYLASPALDRMARTGQVWWGVFAAMVLALTLRWPRWFGLVAALSLACVRAYDFWHDDRGHNWFFVAGQAVFFLLALRGTYRRAVYYG